MEKTEQLVGTTSSTIPGSRLSVTLLWAVVLVLLIATVSMLSLMYGAQPTPVDTVWRVLWSPDNSLASILLWQLRLPRLLVALAAGAGLALAGLVMQKITRNPLASPSLTGVTSGAALAVVVVFVFLPTVVTPHYYPFVALVGGLLSAALTLFVSGAHFASPMRLALAGITVSFLASALTSVLLLSTGPQSGTLLFWLSGGLQGRSWMHLNLLLPWLSLGLLGVLISQRPMILLSLGDDTAQAMGMNSARWRAVLMLFAVMITAGVVSVVGPIAFVGLCVPHIARLLGAQKLSSAILLSTLVGMVLLAGADLLARTVAAPREIPVSVLTALVGGPIFIALIMRQKGG